MPSKPDIEGLPHKPLGKEMADAILSKTDKMVAEGASPAKIERCGLVPLASSFA
jgi:hypothetical protein